MLERVIARHLSWVTFEPANERLHQAIIGRLDDLLFEFFQQGLFAGSTPTSSYFVRIDRQEAKRRQDVGQLIVEIGVSIAEPIEFILLRFRQSEVGTISLDNTNA
jgi:uncharacterized protein